MGYSASTTLRGESTFFLRTIKETLSAYAHDLGIELKEAHLRDDLIELMLHEALHRALTEERRNYPEWEIEFHFKEENIVDSIAQDVMKDVRELPRLERTGGYT